MNPVAWPSKRPSRSRENVLPDLQSLASIPFHEAPGPLRRRAYGVPYVQLDDLEGGVLWVTCHGWRHLEHLDPARWYMDRQYSALECLREVCLRQPGGVVRHHAAGASLEQLAGLSNLKIITTPDY